LSLLTVCQGVARRIGITTPSAIVANTNDPDAMLLWELANVEGYALSQRAFWSRLRVEHTFTTLAADSQGDDSIPDDFECIVPETMFNRTARRKVCGPISVEAWQEYKSSLIVPADPVFLQRGDVFLMAPTQTAGQSIYYEYISTKWALSSGGAAQTEFLADTDTTIFKDIILKQGILWRWKAHKGLEHETDRFDYEKMVVDQILRDGVKPRLQLADTTPRMARGRATMRDYDTIS